MNHIQKLTLFRYFSSPKVMRDLSDEKGNFKIFENPIYSTFNFTYNQEAFDNLSALMEYNVLNNLDKIKDELVQGTFMILINGFNSYLV